MKTKRIKSAAALLLIMALLCGCGAASAQAGMASGETATGGSKDTAESSSTEEKETEAPVNAETDAETDKNANAGAQEGNSANAQEETAEAAELPVEQIENNGGYFVRIDNKIYFRKYGQQALESSAIFGNFLFYGHSGGSSSMLAFDPGTGDVTEAFEDEGYGCLFAGDGGFYCKKKAGDGNGDTAYWISLDGTQSVALGNAVPVGITAETLGNTLVKEEAAPAQSDDSASETASAAPGSTSPEDHAAYLTLQDQDPDHFGDLFILHGGTETARAVRGAYESLVFCGMTGEYAIYMVCDTEKKANYLYSLSGKSGETVCLGEMTIPKDEFYIPILETEQFLSDEMGVYIVAATYQGTGHFLSYTFAVTAVPGTADSLKPIEDSGNVTGEGTENEEKEDDGKNSEGAESEEAESVGTETGAETEAENDVPYIPILFLAAPGEAEIVPNPAGTAGLSEGSYGDLVYYDSPYSALKLIPDYLPEGEWASSDRRFLQTAEVIGDSVYIIMADASRNEEADIGWRMAYKMTGMDWLRVPLSAGTQDSSGNEGKTTPLAHETY